MRVSHTLSSVLILNSLTLLFCLSLGFLLVSVAHAQAAQAKKLVPIITSLLSNDDQAVGEPPIIHIDAGKHLARPLSNDLPFGHYLYLPQDYSSDSRVNFPLILFLHGLGEKGNGTTQLIKVLRNGPPKMISRGHHFPAIVVSPQLNRGVGDWERINGGQGIDNSRSLNDLVKLIKRDYNVDDDRIYVTGLSLGGGGAWAYARKYAEEIAAVVPICGVNTGATGIPDLANKGVWAFHSFHDNTVGSGATVRQMNRIADTTMGATDGVLNGYPRDNQDYVLSRESMQWIWRAGRYNATGNLRFTMFPDANHNAWTRAYNDNGGPSTPMWEWLFNQKRN